MSTNDENSLLSIEDIEVQYGNESLLMKTIPDSVKNQMGWEHNPAQAVKDVSLDIQENEVVTLIGESGSGKTTLGKTAIGLQKPTNGNIYYRGHDIWKTKEQPQTDGLFYDDIRRALQIVHQDPGAALNPYRTLMTTLKIPLGRWHPEMSDVDHRERIHSLLDASGLTPAREYANRYPHELSGGEKQRVVLARAMLVEPDLILADEPVSALDPSLQIDIMNLMLELQDMFGTSFLFVSHNLEQARYISNKADGRIAIMYLGEIVEIGPAEEVIQNPKHPYTKILKWATLPKHPDEARRALNDDSPLRQLDIPDITNPPSGCRFHTRCPKAREACINESPDLFAEDASDHRTACYRELPNHEYWESESLSEDKEENIPS